MVRFNQNSKPEVAQILTLLLRASAMTSREYMGTMLVRSSCPPTVMQSPENITRLSPTTLTSPFKLAASVFLISFPFSLVYTPNVVEFLEPSKLPYCPKGLALAKIFPVIVFAKRVRSGIDSVTTIASLAFFVLGWGGEGDRVYKGARATVGLSK